MIVLIQTSLLCGCGAAEFDAAGLCTSCHRRARLSREQFAGLREFVLRRDAYQCQACGEMDEALLLVHHRKPGALSARWMVVLCRRCHPRIHHTHRPSFAFASVAFLRQLWREANPRVPEQLLLLSMLADDGDVLVQPSLFVDPATA